MTRALHGARYGHAGRDERVAAALARHERDRSDDERQVAAHSGLTKCEREDWGVGGLGSVAGAGRGCAEVPEEAPEEGGRAAPPPIPLAHLDDDVGAQGRGEHGRQGDLLGGGGAIHGLDSDHRPGGSHLDVLFFLSTLSLGGAAALRSVKGRTPPRERPFVE